MNRYTANTLILFCLLGASISALATWKEGDFSGELNWKGNVTQTRNPWVWHQPDLPDLPGINFGQAEQLENRLVWKGLLTRSVILAGQTESLMPEGRTGVTPRIHYGEKNQNIQVQWIKDGIARITLPASGKGRESGMSGSLTFLLRTGAVIVATQNGIRQGGSAVSTPGDGSNGVPPAGSAADISAVISLLQGAMNEGLPSWLSPGLRPAGEIPLSSIGSANMKAVGSAYAAEIIPGSGELHFPAGAVPTSWEVLLPVQVTYQ